LLDTRGRQSLLALSVIADAHDLALAEDDDLEEAWDEPLAAEALEPLAAQLHEHAVAEIDHLAGAQAVRVGAPEQGADDLVRARAGLPRALACGMPGRVVVEVRAQRPVIRAAREAKDLLDRGGIRAWHQPTSGSDLTIEPASRRASIASAIATIVCAVSESGWDATIGNPRSPCSRSNGSRGTWPSSGTPRSSASDSPPPKPKIS